MRKGKGKVIWTHPKGRFELIEYVHHGFGGTYKTRECRLTPKKDARGLTSDVLPEAVYIAPELRIPRTCTRGPVSGADVDQWCEWYKEGKIVADIAEMAGRSKTTIAARLRKRGLLPDLVPKVTEKEVRKMERMYSSGMSVSQIAKEIGRNMQTVRNHLREMEVLG